MLMPTPLYHLLTWWARQFPVPQGLPGEAHEDACRQWTTRFAQQAVFQFPSASYGAKRATPDRPLSKDVIALHGDPLIGWDVLIGAGTGRPVIPGAPQESLDLTGQWFESVAAQDYLRLFPPNIDPGPVGPAPPTTDPPSPPTPPCDECSLLQTMVEALVGLRDDLGVVKSELASANEQRQVIIAELARIFSRLEPTPTLEQLTKTPVLVKFKW